MVAVQAVHTQTTTKAVFEAITIFMRFVRFRHCASFKDDAVQSVLEPLNRHFRGSPYCVPIFFFSLSLYSIFLKTYIGGRNSGSIGFTEENGGSVCGSGVWTAVQCGSGG